MKCSMLFPLILALAGLSILVSPPFQENRTGAAWAQSSQGKNFIPLGRVPYLLQPGGQGTPTFRRGGKRVRFLVDAASLPQNLSRDLSNRCAHGTFNSIKPGRYYVEIETQDGKRKRLSYANAEGFNLRDPDNVRGTDLAFLFELDRTSQCRVYAVPVIF